MYYFLTFALSVLITLRLAQVLARYKRKKAQEREGFWELEQEVHTLKFELNKLKRKIKKLQ